MASGGERRSGVITVMFTDLSDSTSLTTRVGDEEAHRILKIHHEIVRRQLIRHNGEERSFQGDGFMAIFDSPREAIRCSIEMQRAFDSHNRQHPERRLAVRIGLNAGELITTGPDPFGAAINAAARICARAEGGQILVGDVVRLLTGDLQEGSFVDAGRHRLKGFPHPHHLWEVAWEPDAISLELTPFTDRIEERQQLARALDRASSGKGALFILSGQPGIGKSRLSYEALRSSREREMITAQGRCYEGAHLPYGPIGEVLASIVAQLEDDVLEEVMADVPPVILRTFPELQNVFPAAESGNIAPDQERRLLLTSIASLLFKISAMSPITLMIDDVQWADESSLLLLQQLAPNIDSHAIVLLLTIRDSEADQTAEVARTLESLQRVPGTVDLQLGPIRDEDVANMIESLTGRTPSESLVKALHGSTSGNPFFTEELIRLLNEELDVTAPRSSLDPLIRSLPRSIDLLLERRLDKLDDTVVETLEHAAVIGREFELEVLEGVAVKADSVFAHLRAAKRVGIVEPVDESGSTHRFTHELVRHTLLRRLSPTQLQKIHLAAAETMSQSSEESDRIFHVAHHLLAAGPLADDETTTRALLRSSAWALRSGAFEQALRDAEEASTRSTSGSQEAAEALACAAAAQRALGKTDEALDTWRKTVAAYDALGDEASAGKACYEMTVQLAWAGRWAECFEVVPMGLSRLNPQSREHLRLSGVSAVLLSMAGFPDNSLTSIQENLARAELTGDPYERGFARMVRSLHHWGYMESAAMVEDGTIAAKLLREAGALSDLSNLLGFLQYRLLLMGRIAEAASLDTELGSLAASLGNVSDVLATRRNKGVLDLIRKGDLRSFERFVREDFEWVKEQKLAWTAHSYTWMGLLSFWRGDLDGAVQHLKRAVGGELPGIFLGSEWAFLWLVRAYGGDIEVSLSMLEDRSSLLSAQEPRTLGSWAMVLTAVEGLVELQAYERAAELYPVVLDGLGTGTKMRIYDYRSLETIAGMAADAGERFEEAAEHFQQALHLAEDLPHQMERAEARRAYARMLLRRRKKGDTEQASRLLAEALPIYRKLGMPRHEHLALDLHNRVR